MRREMADRAVGAHRAAVNRQDRVVELTATLERARSVAVELEAQNAALIEFIRPIADRGCRNTPARLRPCGECKDRKSVV